jgi:ABC-type transport system substrate-binding protein
MLRIVARLAAKIGSLLTQYEKMILAILAVVIVISGTIWFRQFAGSRGSSPTIGGTYVDGVVGGQEEIQTIASKLTKSGLFTVDAQGNLQNQLITRWEANSEKTIYSFQIAPEVNGEEILKGLNDNLDLIGPARLNLLEGKTLTIELDKPNVSLPLLLAQPLFDYGPYKVGKMTEKTTVFTRNTRAGAQSAYINKIIVHTFPDEGSLKKAFAKKNIDGGTLSAIDEVPDGYEKISFKLPRYYLLVLNINRAPFRDLAARQQLFNQSLTKPFTLTVPNAEPYRGFAAKLSAEWQKHNVPATVEYKDQEEITNKIGPSRDFQAILVGVEYGAELDPYYVWHSSQIRPPANNVSGIKDQRVDDLIAQIRGELNPSRRREMINSLHILLKDLGVALVLKQEESSFLLKKTINYKEPWLPLAPRDRWQSISQWSIK